MCGIAGFFLNDGEPRQAMLEAMCGLIRHRGPDDQGILIDRGLGIGMRRLSIIDLSGGHQPLGNEDGSLQIVFNGEIYNYQELRHQLDGQGHVFRTNSDTEAVVHLFEQEGVEGFKKLRGMFALAIWDKNKRQLTLARDRFGKKPLYVARADKGLYFGSEMKCLRLAGVPLELDEDALRLYFQFLYIPEPRSPFQAIRKLAPGGWLTYTEGGASTEGLYWRLPEPTSGDAATSRDGLTRDQVKGKLRDLFDESVRLRMIADVPLGAFLSGGIDSSSVVASMARQTTAPVKTFSIGFEEADYNELPAAKMVADYYKTEHHEIVLRPDCVGLVSHLVDYFDEPFGDSSAIPTYLVSQFAVQHVKVALTGDGGDELFAGYESFFLTDKLRRYDAVPQAARGAMRTLAKTLPYAARGKNYLWMTSRPTPLERYFESNHMPHFLRDALFEPKWARPFETAYLRRQFNGSLLPDGTDVLSQALYFEATAKLTGDFLVKVDRMSMANSLEVRSPLLDHELAEFAQTIPNGWKTNSGKGKRILLEAIGDRLPPQLLSLPKKGFGVPLNKWFRNELRPMLWDHLLDRKFLDRGFVREPFLRSLLDEHQRGRRDNSHWLYALLMFELWLRAWQSEPVPAFSAR